MFSNKCTLHNRSGIEQLDRIGDLLVITNKWLYDELKPRKFVLVDENKNHVHSVHGSQYAAVVYAQKHSNRPD
jgi:hypothetical protein